MITDLEFVEYFAARICHDLSGTIGAIGNALEFLESDDITVKKKAMELIQLSSTQANEKLKFFRHAYGIAKYNGEADLASLKTLCHTIINDSRVTLEFLAPGTIPQEKNIDVNTGKLILCLAFLAKSSLIYGGTVKVSMQDHNNKSVMIVSASGTNMKIQTDMHNIILGDKEIDINPNNIHAYYIHRLVELLGIKLAIDVEKEKINYIIDSM